MTGPEVSTIDRQRSRAQAWVASMRQGLGRPDRLVRLAASFVAALYLAVTVLLGTWLAVIMLTTGWQPVVITGGSMQPALRVGDVLLVDEHPDELLGQRSVITFDPVRGSGPVTHRIHEVLPESQTYITKGDANPEVDTDPVRPSQVVGVGRLVIPVLGLPLVWARSGDLPALGALVILSIGAVAAVGAGVIRGGASTRGTTGRSSEMASRGIRRVRFLAGLMIVGGLYLDGSSVESSAWGAGRFQLVAASFALLMAINLVSTFFSSRRGRDQPEWLIVIELAADTLLAGALVALTGESGIAWAFIALPIVEAAVRYRLAGALLHWVVMTLLTVGARLFALDRAGAPLFEIVAELERLLDQLGILLLLVVPGAYLTEQLVTDVLRQDRATSMAIERARLLERVAETGYEMNRLGTELFATLTTAVTGLGFDQGDAHVRLPDGGWRVLSSSYPSASRALPEPGDAGSGLRIQDLDLTEVVVDRDDPELSEIQALRSHDLELLARLTVSSEEGRHVVVRAATSAGSSLRAGSIDALRLLTGQAAVALQNDQLVSELQDVQVELARQALQDALTGLPNRAQFMNDLEEGLADARDPERRHVVMFLDLNGFKAVNDTLGHEAGDALLVGVAGRLVRAVGQAGVVARLGGDEFTVLLHPVPGVDAALEVVERIHDILGEPFQLGDEMAEVGSSVGLAVAEIGLSGTEILRRADAAMYAAKSTKTKRRTAVYSPELDDQAQRRGRLTAEFVKALEGGGLHLVYQPLVTSTGAVRGVEALLRWVHDEMGPISTATVLELAENADRVDQLTEFIFRRALSDISGCGIPEDHPFTLAVNVTPTELMSERLIDVVASALADHRWPAERFMIELNERIVADGKASLANVTRVMELGIGLSLDDFGEGRTSLAHLRGLPINQLKLDRGLVQQAVTSEADGIILKSVIGLAHDLGFEVVAEGVETRSQLEATISAGADLLQGFGLYRPMRLASLRHLLREQGVFTTDVRSGPGDVGSPVGAPTLPRRTSTTRSNPPATATAVRAGSVRSTPTPEAPGSGGGPPTPDVVTRPAPVLASITRRAPARHGPIERTAPVDPTRSPVSPVPARLANADTPLLPRLVQRRPRPRRWPAGPEPPRRTPPVPGEAHRLPPPVGAPGTGHPPVPPARYRLDAGRRRSDDGVR